MNKRNWKDIFSGGALRGAGDTTWCMFVSIVMHWLMLMGAYYSISVFKVPPLLAWGIFTMMVVTLAVFFFGRFRQGKWKEIQMVS